jgi:hypothetical protein
MSELVSCQSKLLMALVKEVAKERWFTLIFRV